MKSERVLITVKTYPTLSKSYIELVCTAGMREDGSWVRIYPVPFRLLNSGQKFGKWHWVELPLMRRAKDVRPESYSPIDRNNIEVSPEPMGRNDNWRERRELVLEKGKVWTNLTELIEAGKRNELSLATFKPTELNFVHKAADARDWDSDKIEAIKAQMLQSDMFEENCLPENFKIADKLPYDFSYKIKDDAGKESTMRILDWEIGMLYWNCLERASGDEKVALEKVRQKYLDEFSKRDLYLFLGTIHEWHLRAPNPWTIIGTFHPPVVDQFQLPL